MPDHLTAVMTSHRQGSSNPRTGHLEQARTLTGHDQSRPAQSYPPITRPPSPHRGTPTTPYQQARPYVSDPVLPAQITSHLAHRGPAVKCRDPYTSDPTSTD